MALNPPGGDAAQDAKSIKIIFYDVQCYTLEDRRRWEMNTRQLLHEKKYCYVLGSRVPLYKSSKRIVAHPRTVTLRSKIIRRDKKHFQNTVVANSFTDLPIILNFIGNGILQKPTKLFFLWYAEAKIISQKRLNRRAWKYK